MYSRPTKALHIQSHLTSRIEMFVRCVDSETELPAFAGRQ
jgi:hypothetical protein